MCVAGQSHYIPVMLDRVRKTATLTVRITPEAKQQLAELAAADDRSVAGYLENIIKRLHRKKATDEVSSRG